MCYHCHGEADFRCAVEIYNFDFSSNLGNLSRIVQSIPISDLAKTAVATSYDLYSSGVTRKVKRTYNFGAKFL